MTTTRYDLMFEKVQREHRGVFIPFLVVGDPDMETSVVAMQALIDAGADALELGIPFSDPVADGPTIQAAVLRSLAAGATPSSCFAAISRIRAANPDIPIGILTYANAVFQTSFDAYFANVKTAGIDSVLTADIPVFEAAGYAAAAQRDDICPVFIAPPNARDEQLSLIAKYSKGYTYVVARSGVTGCDDQVTTAFSEIIDRLKAFGAPRPVVGFGISEPRHVAQVVAAGGAGAISGSKVVQLLFAAGTDRSAIKESLSGFVTEMKRATVPVLK